MRRMTLLAIMAIGVFGLLMVAAPSMAVHKGAGSLTCGACHTMHNSQGNTVLEGVSGGSLILLRAALTSRAEIHKLCLTCHAENGTSAGIPQAPHFNTAPKVFKTSAIWDGGSFDSIGAGGDFSATINLTYDLTDADVALAVGRGHSIGITTPTPPGAIEAALDSFSCTSCHDPHGASASSSGTSFWGSSTINSFRNLRMSPTGGGGAATNDTDGGVTLDHVAGWVGSSSGAYSGTQDWSGSGSPGAANHFWPVVNSAGNKANVYYSGGATTMNDGISGWCAQCHDEWHETERPGNKSGSDWKRHPVKNSLAADGSPLSGGGVTIVDFDWYSTTVTANNKLPAAQDVASAGLNNTGNNAYFANNTADEVMCLSCHFAHGGPYYDNLRWDYLTDVAAGSQTATEVGATVGCQQCHNR